MNNTTKGRIVKILLYLVLGFVIAFFWHKIKEK